jgi:hypothetical protein
MIARLTAVLILLAGCHRAGSGLVSLEIEAAPGLTLDQVDVAVTTAMTVGGTPLNQKRLPWAPGSNGKLSLGLYVPASVSGLTWVHAQGLRGGSPVASADPRSTEVHPGAVSALVSLRLSPTGTTPPPDGGTAPDGPPSDVVARLDAASSDGAGSADASADGGGASPTWSPPANVENDPVGREGEAVVAVDPIGGDAVAAFAEGRAQVKAIRYRAAARSWDAPQVVASGARIGEVRVGVDAGHHAVVIWSEGGRGIVESHSADGGTTWSPSALIRATPDGIHTSLAVGRGGRARAAWEESNVGGNSVMLTAYWDGAAWSAAAMPLDSQDFFSTRQASIAVDGNGAGWIAWSQPEPTSARASARLYVARFTGAALEPPQILDKDPGSVQPPPVLAMAAGGSAAVVVWQQNYQAGGNDLLASLWSPAAGWSAPEKAVVGSGELPALVMDGSGAVALAYQKILTTATRNVVVVQRPAGQPWSAPMALETDNSAPGGAGVDEGNPSPVATADAQGNVQVAWRKGRSATTYGLSARRYVPGKGWDPEIAVAAREGLLASWPLSMGTTDAGRSVLVWVYGPKDPTVAAPDAYSMFASFFP